MEAWLTPHRTPLLCQPPFTSEAEPPRMSIHRHLAARSRAALWPHLPQLLWAHTASRAESLVGPGSSAKASPSFLWNLRGHHAHDGSFNWCCLLSLDRMPAVPGELGPFSSSCFPTILPLCHVPRGATSSGSIMTAFQSAHLRPKELGLLILGRVSSLLYYLHLYSSDPSNIHVMVSMAE